MSKCPIITNLSMARFIFTLVLCSAVFLTVSCRSEVTITRELKNEGFHRELVTNIDIYSSSETYPCFLLLVEYLPNTVYVDSDQILGLKDKTGLLSFLNTSVNIEVTSNSEKAIPFKTYIFPSQQETPKVTRKVELPVHLRYQAPNNGGGYKHVNIGQPTLFQRCSKDNSEPGSQKFDFPCSVEDKKSCKWTKLDATVTPITLTADVPLGNTDFGLYVSVVSFALVYGATFFIAKTIYYKTYY